MPEALCSIAQGFLFVHILAGKVVRLMMEKQTEQEIWRRVRGPGGPTAEEAILPERLEALIVEQRADAAALRELSGRLRGPQAAALSRMAVQAGKRAQELTTLHYLLTGRRLRLQTPRRPSLGPLPEALRATWLRMRQTERAFAGLQTEFSAYEDDFGHYVLELRANSRTLAATLQGQLQDTKP